ncbi:hypothetical protein [Glaciihabitans sp. dw_435]|uniref:hypothetical protein n=1 Tax=Glaciihabitans sp. dw_435 TaxID=2720081 RepID=UPI001BD4FD91|nr:hypothetical protein [Glaciihabitans sp. dw_435]
MKVIHYAGDALTTGDAIAEALVGYAEALARRETSAAISIPVRMRNGNIAMASVLIGPASQLTAVPADVTEETDVPGGEILDEDLVERLQRDTAALANSHPQAAPVIENENDEVIKDFEAGS